MKTFPKTILTLFIKDNKTNWTPVTKQTQTIRDRTNNKIKNLGQKYYQVKRIFDQNNIQRDYLFEFGRKIEEQYKDIKKIEHLQSQCKRMKEALVCWFSENFFSEITQPNSPLLNELILWNRINLNKTKKTKSKIDKRNVQKNKNLPINTNENKTMTAKKDMMELDSEQININTTITPEINANEIDTLPTNQGINNSFSFLNGMKINEEIDEFEINDTSSNASNQNSIPRKNNNFDFFNI